MCRFECIRECAEWISKHDDEWIGEGIRECSEWMREGVSRCGVRVSDCGEWIRECSEWIK